jgi:hypothetical protein
MEFVIIDLGEIGLSYPSVPSLKKVAEKHKVIVIVPR